MKNKKTIFYINIFLASIVAALLLISMSPQLFERALAAIGNITGEGNVNRIARFAIGAPLDPTNQIGNSIIYDTGTNVGIGTASPAEKLHVVGDIFATTGFNLPDDTGASRTILSSSGDAYVLSGVHNSNTTGYLRFHTGDGPERMRITASGNVGIGTASPVDVLQLHSPAHTRISITSDVTGGTAQNGLQIGLTDSGGPISSFIWNYENSPLRFATNNTERVRIDSVGNVGIGTVMPGAKLEVVTPSAGVDAIRIRGNDGNYKLQINVDNFVASVGGTGSSAGFYVNNANNTASLMVVKNNGNVGIGTVSPTRKLEVLNGSIFISGGTLILGPRTSTIDNPVNGEMWMVQ